MARSSHECQMAPFGAALVNVASWLGLMMYLWVRLRTERMG